MDSTWIHLKLVGHMKVLGMWCAGSLLCSLSFLNRGQEQSGISLVSRHLAEVLLRSRFVSCRQLVITFYQSCQGFNPFVAAESRHLIIRICKCHCIDMSCAALWYCLSSCIAVASKYSSLLIQSILWNLVSSWLVMIIWGIRFSIDQNSCQTGP